MLFDTHSHIYLGKLKGKEKETIKNFKEVGVKYIISIGIDLETSKTSIDLSKKYDFIYATVGIHPSDVKNFYQDKNKTIYELEKLIIDNKDRIVGIGETGLDYYWIDKKIFEEESKKQKEFFIAHIDLAKKYSLPLIIHNRNAKNDVFKILKDNNFKNFILHCYSENLDFAKKCIEFSPNCKISFSGILTYKSAKDIQETAKNIPLKNILIETDSPFLAPQKVRGQVNQPSFIIYTMDKLIELRYEENNKIVKLIFQNSLDIFGINEK